MEGIKIEVTGNIARVTQKPTRITSGTVGLPVEFTFDSQWDGLKKVAVFQGGHTIKTVDFSEADTVPWEVLVKPKVYLSVGVYGVNEDGSVAIPTTLANVGRIHVGVNPDGDPTTDPTLPIWQTIMNAILSPDESLTIPGRPADAFEVGNRLGALATRHSGYGAPTVNTKGAVGEVYLDESTYRLYVCISDGAVNGEYSWELVAQKPLVVEYFPETGNADHTGYEIFEAANNDERPVWLRLEDNWIIPLARVDHTGYAVFQFHEGEELITFYAGPDGAVAKEVTELNSSTSILVVVLDCENNYPGYPSHTAEEIFAHVSAGGSAVLFHNHNYTYYNLLSCTTDCARFGDTEHVEIFDETGETDPYWVMRNYGWTIDEFGAVTSYDQSVSTENTSLGDIATALDTIIAMQDELIGGGTT